jgi:SAM-dependent methyltransferase
MTIPAPASADHTQHSAEVAAGTRFAFGDNWTRFLRLLDDDRVALAEASLKRILCVTRLDGRRFLDVGSGSGLFSLAARRLGATVRSFDYDPKSVACTSELRRRYFPDDPQWLVTSGSVLDQNFLRGLGQYDVVYSWGVLHHTGAMHTALDHVSPLVAPGGQLFVAIYNDQGAITRYWTVVKRIYNSGIVGRALMTAVHAPYLVGLRWLVRALTTRLTLDRGMSLWYDMRDWLGGYPFEVARPEEIFTRYRRQGFVLDALVTCGGRMGCNEFVFRAPAGE